jgi:hypothetical protein
MGRLSARGDGRERITYSIFTNRPPKAMQALVKILGQFAIEEYKVWGGVQENNGA